MERAKKGREIHLTRKAAKEDRFGLVKQTKSGKKKVVRQDVNTMSVSLAGQKSKFKSCFGEIQDLPGQRRVYVPSSQRKKTMSYFDTVKMNHSATESDQHDGVPQQEPVHDQPTNSHRQEDSVPQEPALTQEDEEREPKLYVDVNVANFGVQRIIVYEGDTVDSLVANFVKRCPIDEFMVEKLKTLLQQQIDGVLERIDEDEDLDDLDDMEGEDSHYEEEEKSVPEDEAAPSSQHDQSNHGHTQEEQQQQQLEESDDPCIDLQD